MDGPHRTRHLDHGGGAVTAGGAGVGRGEERGLDDPEFQRLYLACDRVLDWDSDDPRLVGLAADIAGWDARRTRHGEDQPQTVA
jgi:hypothetical protein